MIDFNKLSFPEKVFLTGEDCFFMMLESNLHRHQSGNNVLRIVLHFDTCVAAESLMKQFTCSPIIHWMCNVKLVRGGAFHKPFWQYANSGRTIPIWEHFLPREHGLPNEVLNRSMSIEQNRYIECDIIRHNEGSSMLVLSWHHILMDGRGAGMLLRHLSGQVPFNEENWESFFPEKPKQLSLYRYVRNMYKVKAFIQGSSKGKIASFYEVNNINEKSAFSWYSKTFSYDDTCLVDSNSRQNGARLGANNFLIAATSMVLFKYLKNREKDGSLWIPIPYDGRKRGGFGPVITNQISFLFFRLNTEDFDSIQTTVQAINKQFADQLKNEMPKKYNHLLDMMRHIPMGLYRFLATRESKGAISSFLFSSAGENNWDMKNLISQDFTNIDIIPPHTFPPGITFSFFRLDGKLKMNLVVSDHILPEEEAHLVIDSISSILLHTRA